MPYSGPVSAFGALGKGEVGYFKMLNERGGINGRKVDLISLDDGYAPPKTVESLHRKYPQAGLRHQESGIANAAAGHQDQHLTDRPRSGRADAVHALQRQELEAFWRAADRELK
jgi:Periplasmic binding protein